MGLIAGRYARAILEFAETKQESALVMQQMKQLVESFKQVPGLQNLMENPAVEPQTKKTILLEATGNKTGEVFGISVDLLIQQKRLHEMVWIATQYIALFNRKNNIHEVVLTTASGIDKATEQSLLNWIEKEVKGEVSLTRVTDERIMGGFVLDVDFNRWDASLSTNLKELKNHLLS